MKNLTRRQQKIAKRQELLSQTIPNAISCEYIASVSSKLPNGFEIKSINLNHNGYAFYMMGFKDKQSKNFVSNETVKIQGVNIHYILLNN